MKSLASLHCHLRKLTTYTLLAFLLSRRLPHHIKWRLREVYTFMLAPRYLSEGWHFISADELKVNCILMNDMKCLSHALLLLCAVSAAADYTSVTCDTCEDGARGEGGECRSCYEGARRSGKVLECSTCSQGARGQVNLRKGKAHKGG